MCSFPRSQFQELEQKTVLLAFRNLWQMNRTDLCIDLFPHYEKLISDMKPAVVDVDIVCSFIKYLSILDRMDLLDSMISKLGFSPSSNGIGDPTNESVAAIAEILPLMALGYATNGFISKALGTLHTLQSLDFDISVEDSKKILIAVQKNGNLDSIRRYRKYS